MRSYLLLLVLVVAATPAGLSAEPLPVELATRAGLFHYYQGDDLNALTLFPDQLDLVNPPDRITIHKSQARFGLVNTAESGLQFITRNFDGHIGATAAFELGRLQFALGKFREAMESFSRINQLDKKLLPVYQNYHALTFLKLSNIPQAARTISKMDEGVWAGYGYYNLARAYYDADTNVSRPMLALRVADALNVRGKDGGESEEKLQRHLSDRIMLASARMAFENGEREKARGFLEKIHTDGIYVAEALYLHGLTYFQKEQYRNAIQSWYRVKKYPLTRPGVSAAYSGIALAYLNSGNKLGAIESYLETISVHEQELRTMDEIAKVVKSKGFDHAMIKESSLDRLDSFLEESVNANTPKAAYLVYFADAAGMYDQMKDLVEVEKVSDYLRRQRTDFRLFESMLRDRINGFDRVAKKINAGKFKSLTEEAKKRLERVSEEKAQAVARQDFLAVASREVQDQVDRLQRLRARATYLKENQRISLNDFERIVERVERLNGLLVWNAKDMFRLNLENMDQDIRELEFELESLQHTIARVRGVLKKGPVSLHERLKKVRQETDRIEALIGKSDALRNAIDEKLTERALMALSDRRKVIQREYEAAQLSLARLYERIAKTDRKTGGVQ